MNEAEKMTITFDDLHVIMDTLTMQNGFEYAEQLTDYLWDNADRKVDIIKDGNHIEMNIH